MKVRKIAFQVAAGAALMILGLSLTARPASAQLFRRPVVIVTPAYPTYVTASPVVVTEAPIATTYSVPVSSVAAAPLVDTALVPTTYAPSTYVTTSAVTSYYPAQAVVAAPVRGRIVYPRRVYRFGY